MVTLETTVVSNGWFLCICRLKSEILKYSTAQKVIILAR